MSLQDLDTAVRFWPQSRAIMLRVQGYPVHDSATPGNVTVAPVSLDTVTTYVYKYSFTFNNQTYHTATTTLPTVVLANLDAVNEFTSVQKLGDPNV